MNSLATLCYRSDAVLARPDDLAAIGASAQRHNDENDITGCLFHHDGRYFQLLEGPMRQLFALMLRLEKDKRHRCLDICSIMPISRRMFAGWPLAVLSDIETARLVASADPATRAAQAYFEPLARLQTAHTMSDILQHRRQSERLRA